MCTSCESIFPSFNRWKAPADFEGEVYFRYSTVVDYDKYWTNIDSPKIRVTRDAPSTGSDSAAPENPPAVGNTETPEKPETTERDSNIVFPDEEKSTNVDIDQVALDPVTSPTSLSTSSAEERYALLFRIIIYHSQFNFFMFS